MNKRIGELLIERGLIQQDDIKKALQLQQSIGGRVGAGLVRMGAISEDALLDALSIQLNIPVVRSGSDIPDATGLYAFAKSAPIDINWCIDNRVLIWADDEGQLNFISRDPLLPFIHEVLRYHYPDSPLKPWLITSSSLDNLVDYVRREVSAERFFAEGSETKGLREMAEEAPVVELVNNIFAKAVAFNASDIHLDPQEDVFRVRLRVDGILQTQLEQPIDRYPAVASRVKLISEIDIAERRLPQDGRITTRVNGREMDVRVSTLPGVHGESIVMRLLPKDRKELSLETLGLEPDHIELVRSLMQESNGIVLVTGPTGSGKSTTLYAALQEATDGTRKILTVEDPVEYQLPGITQVQAHSEIGYTFARALRAFLRQDPDVIMVGEIRDVETAQIAIQSALTGHLVLSTLHTNDSLSAFTRLIDMGVEPFLVAAPIKAVQAQRLVRKICKHCAKPSHVPESIAAEFSSLKTTITPNWVEAVGCAACNNTGYSGRMGIYEIVPISGELHDMIVENVPVAEMRKLARSQGHRNMYQDGLIKAAKGLTTVEEVLRTTSMDIE
ncbi:GspE/PulE family protein [Cellvibrio zantedeschiae]|uniref:GspE/PulE family protein n=1 Tax=Cellvibrio zantedeschiae TaxID=1237077 RepID=UPI001E57E80D|nr:type II/IV secretion system protein [Cellvibrio zantedeschiae]